MRDVLRPGARKLEGVPFVVNRRVCDGHGSSGQAAKERSGGLDSWIWAEASGAQSVASRRIFINIFTAVVLNESYI